MKPTDLGNNNRTNSGAAQSLREYGSVAVLLAIALLLVFLKELWQGINLYVVYFSDAIPYYLFYPSEVFTARQLAKGVLPLWDNLRGLGEPNMVPIGVTMMNPLRLFIFLFPGETGLTLFVLARLWVCGFGMYFAGKQFRLGRAGAMIAALSYMLCGYFMEFLSFQDMNAYPMLPLALGFWKKYTMKQTILRLLIAILAMELIYTAGHPEAIFYNLAVFSFWALTMVISPRIPRHIKAAGMCVFVVVILWGSFSRALEYFSFTEFWANGWHYHLRGFGRLHHDVRAITSLIHPFFNAGSAITRGELIIGNTVHTPPSYIGLLPFVLAITAISRIRRQSHDAIFAAILLIVSLGVIFGLPVFAEVARFPLVGASHNHRYFQPLAALAAAVLAGAGAKEILDSPSRIPAVTAAVVTLVLTAMIIYCGLEGLKSVSSPEYRRLFPTLVLVTLALAAIIAAVFYLYSLKKLTQNQVAAVILAMLFINLVASKFFVGPPGIARKTLPRQILNDSPANWQGQGRIYGTGRYILHPNLAELFNLNDLRDQSPLLPQRYARLMIKINKLTDEKSVLENFIASGFYLSLDLDKIDPKWLDLLGVDRVLSWTEPGSVDLWPQFYRSFSGFQPRADNVGIIPFGVGGITRQSLVFLSPGMLYDKVEIPLDAMYWVIASSGNRFSKPACNTILLKDGEKSKVAYSRCFDSNEIGWREAMLNMEKYRGKKIELALTSVPNGQSESGPSPVVWGDGFVTTNKKDPSLELIRNSDFRIYRNNDALPIAFVTREKPPADVPQNVVPLMDKVRRDAAKVISNDAEKVSVEIAPQKGDWLVLSRVYYPGWYAFVTDSNGKRTERKISPSLEAFLTISLEPQDRKVEIFYKPFSIRVGLWATFIFHAFLLAMICFAAAHRIS